MEPLRLPLPPSENNLHGTAKNGRKYRKDHYEAWRNDAGWLLLSQRPPKFTGPVEIAYAFSDTSKCDLGNLEKACTDLLVAHQIIPDDRKKFVRRIILEWSTVEGCEVTISKA